MPAPLPLWEDYDGTQLRRLARRSGDADQTRRLLALAAIYEGARRCEAAEIGGVGRQTIRDWVEAFNELGPEGLVDGQASGAPPRLSPEHRKALARAVEAAPDPDADGVVRWRLANLAQWFWRVHGITVSRQTVGRVLRQIVEVWTRSDRMAVWLDCRLRLWCPMVKLLESSFPVPYANCPGRFAKGVLP